VLSTNACNGPLAVRRLSRSVFTLGMSDMGGKRTSHMAGHASPRRRDAMRSEIRPTPAAFSCGLNPGTMPALLAALLITGCSASGPRDATASEARRVAAECGVVISYFGPRLSKSDHPDFPKVSMIIQARSREDFDTKSSCVYFGLKAMGAESFIGDADGRSLL
jgi:hypothetical protein